MSGEWLTCWTEICTVSGRRRMSGDSGFDTGMMLRESNSSGAEGASVFGRDLLVRKILGVTASKTVR